MLGTLGILGIVFAFVRKKHNKIKISLVCTSTSFFYTWVFVILAFVITFVFPFPPGVDVPLGVAFLSIFFLAPISLFGSLLFVSEMKSKSNRWFLGLPLCTMFVIYLITAIVSPSLVINFNYLFLSSSMLSLFSVLFFLSVPVNQRKMVKNPVRVSTLISIYALLGCCFLFIGEFSRLDTFWGIVTLMFMSYMWLGMEIIGICFLVIAVRYRNQ